MQKKKLLDDGLTESIDAEIAAAVKRFEALGVPDPLGMFVHVSALALISVGISWLVLLREPSQLDALGLSWAPLRGRVPLMVMYGLAGGVATYAINAAVSIGVIMATGGIEKHIGMAKEQHEALSTFAAIPLWVMIPVVIIAGTYEDIVFRGFLLGRLRILLKTQQGWIGDVLSVAISSVIFASGTPTKVGSA
jgi:membrane protease YdiL (CAAX protease family)